jgi:hypothetical protein
MGDKRELLDAFIEKIEHDAYERGFRKGAAAAKEVALNNMRPLYFGDVHAEREYSPGITKLIVSWKLGDKAHVITQTISEGVRDECEDQSRYEAVISKHMAELVMGYLKLKVFTAVSGLDLSGGYGISKTDTTKDAK